MNYEELLEARNSAKAGRTSLAIGDVVKRQVDGKYVSVVEVRPALRENVVFSGGLKTECEQNTRLTSNHLIHFEPVMERDDIKELSLEQVNFVPFTQLLHDNPAVVAEKNFIDNTVRDLLETTAYLHGQGVYHVCYAPQTVMARKGDNGVLLLSHGSYYLNMSNQRELYADMEDYVAPEVLNKGTIDERCDIYSIGKFVEWLFASAEMPYEYKAVVKKATSESPEDRYQSAEDMLKALGKKRETRKSLITFVVALLIALLCVGLYFELVPNTEQIEFVKPAPKSAEDDMLDGGFDEDTELGAAAGYVVPKGVVDTIHVEMTPEEQAQQREYEAKAEQIFRKQYEKEADRILSRIYNKSYMNMSEKKFLSESQSVTEELAKVQAELAAQASLDEARSQLIASEIIERLTNEKKQAMEGKE